MARINGVFKESTIAENIKFESEEEKKERIRRILQAAYDSVTGEGKEIKGFPVSVTRKLEGGSTEEIFGLLVWDFDEERVLFVGLDPDTNAATMGWEEIVDVSLENQD